MQIDRTLGLAELVDATALHDLCAAFDDLFGVPLRVYDADNMVLAEAAREEEYCAYVRGFPEGRRHCGEFRAQTKRYPARSDDHPTIRCFAGGVYLVAGIPFDGDVIGKLVVGPYLPADVARLPSSLLNLDASIDPAALSEKSAGLRRVRQDTVERIVRAFLRVLDLVLHSGQRATLTSDAHLAAIQESYREITDKNERLEATMVRLQELDRLKSNFLATVSHELRTPLTSIIGYSEMLAQELSGPLSEEQKRFVGTILEKGEHLLGLISAVIDVSALDADRLDLHCEPLDLVALCDTAAERVRAQNPRHDVTIRPHAAADVPHVAADPKLIEKALVHLIDNAVKYSPPSGTVDVEVSVTEPAAEGAAAAGFVLLAPMHRFVEVAVRDTGPGIPEDDLDRIFDAFYQVDGSATRTHGGLGIGLALVRQFARAHRGEVRVESSPGTGSVFRLLLPLPPGGGA